MDPLAQEAIRQAKAQRARVTQLIKALQTGGYALVGGPFFEPLTKGEAVKPAAYLWALVGFALLSAVIMLAPYGDKADG